MTKGKSQNKKIPARKISIGEGKRATKEKDKRKRRLFSFVLLLVATA